MNRKLSFFNINKLKINLNLIDTRKTGTVPF